MTQEYKIGSQWTTRGGWLGTVVGHEDGYILVCHATKPEYAVCSHFQDGRFLHNNNSSYDLISPYEPPPVPRSGWVNVYDGGDDGDFIDANIHATKEDAYGNELLNYKRIACVKWTEGEGLEEE